MQYAADPGIIRHIHVEGSAFGHVRYTIPPSERLRQIGIAAHNNIIEEYGSAALAIEVFTSLEGNRQIAIAGDREGNWKSENVCSCDPYRNATEIALLFPFG